MTFASSVLLFAAIGIACTGISSSEDPEPAEPQYVATNKVCGMVPTVERCGPDDFYITQGDCELNCINKTSMIKSNSDTSYVVGTEYFVKDGICQSPGNNIVQCSSNDYYRSLQICQYYCEGTTEEVVPDSEVPSEVVPDPEVSTEVVPNPEVTAEEVVTDPDAPTDKPAEQIE